jgi:hypothetical protein
VHIEGPALGQPVDDGTYSIFSRLQAYDKTRLETKVEEVEDSSPYWRRETVTFPAAYGGERMMLHLFLPKDSTPLYQVVAVFGGSNIFDTNRIHVGTCHSLRSLGQFTITVIGSSASSGLGTASKNLLPSPDASYSRNRPGISLV